jgi:hypothetical protein
VNLVSVERQTQRARCHGQVVFLARWSIGWAVFLAVGEVVRNWGDWQWWPFWMVDFIASALLICGGWFALRPGNAVRLGPLLGGLGFSTAMGYSSFFGHLATLDQPVSGTIPHGPLTVIIGVLFALAAGSFAAALVLAVRLER